MKKTIAVLLTLIFAAYPMAVYAEGVALSDQEMDEIAAGDWVILTEGQSVEEVWYNGNDIELNDEAQTSVQAVSNANAVDSAVAVQTNIASVTGDPTINQAVSGTNIADLSNYNPSEAGSEYSQKSFSDKFSKDLVYSGKDSFSKVKSSGSSSSFSADEVLTIDETLTIASAYAEAGETECGKGCEGESAVAAALVVDYDYDLDYNKDKVFGSSESSYSNKAFVSAESKTLTFSKEKTFTSERGSSYRKNLSENNHINLEDNAQQLVQAVSNLNAVGSGVAIQSNIASNVGVAGTITHLNSATVVSGL